MEPIKILVVEDNNLVRQTLIDLLCSDSELKIVGEAVNGRDGVTKARELKPDVVLMDLQMPVMDGLRATRFIKKSSPESRVIILTIHAEDAYLSEAVEAGAIGYLLKTTPPQTIIKIIKAVASGERFLNLELTKDLQNGNLPQTSNKGQEKEPEPIEDRSPQSGLGSQDLFDEAFNLITSAIETPEEKFYLRHLQQQWALELEALVQTGMALSATLSPTEILEKTRDVVMYLGEAEVFALSLVDLGSLKIETVLFAGLNQEYLKLASSRKLGEGISGWVVREKKPFIAEDASKDDRIAAPIKRALRKEGIRSVLAIPLTAKGKVLGVLEIYKKKLARFSRRQVEIFGALASQAAVAIENARLYKDLEDLFIQTVSSLAAAIDAKDPYTHGHSQNVASLAVELARALKLTPEQIKTIQTAGLLHDIGKISIGDTILLKQKSLSSQELQIIRTHPLVSAKILKPIKALEQIIDPVVSHHEKFDGTGYPYRLRGNKIPLGGRILAVADAFDAMTSIRRYHRPKTLAEARAELLRWSGKQFDPSLVEVFLEKVIA